MLLLITAADLFVQESEMPHFEALRAQTLRDVQPLNSLQAEHTNALIRAAWELRRCDLAERQLAQDLGCDPLLSTDKRIDRIHRWRKDAQRQYRVAQNELRKLQTDMAIRKLEEYEGLKALPAPIDTQIFVKAARLAGGYEKHQRMTFPPLAQAYDRLAKEKGLGQTAWEAWLKRKQQNEAKAA